MAPLLDIALGPAKSIDQKLPQTLLRARQIMPRIHRSEEFVRRNLAIEGGYETLESIFSDKRVNILVVQADRDQYRIR
jgi:hypothetical protein